MDTQKYEITDAARIACERGIIADWETVEEPTGSRPSRFVRTMLHDGTSIDWAWGCSDGSLRDERPEPVEEAEALWVSGVHEDGDIAGPFDSPLGMIGWIACEHPAPDEMCSNVLAEALEIAKERGIVSTFSRDEEYNLGTYVGSWWSVFLANGEYLTIAWESETRQSAEPFGGENMWIATSSDQHHEALTQAELIDILTKLQS